jgi:hypothetical protein
VSDTELINQLAAVESLLLCKLKDLLELKVLLVDTVLRGAHWHAHPLRLVYHLLLHVEVLLDVCVALVLFVGLIGRDADSLRSLLLR